MTYSEGEMACIASIVGRYGPGIVYAQTISPYAKSTPVAIQKWILWSIDTQIHHDRVSTFLFDPKFGGWTSQLLHKMALRPRAVGIYITISVGLRIFG